MKKIFFLICMIWSFIGIAQEKSHDVDRMSAKISKLYNLDQEQNDLCKLLLNRKYEAEIEMKKNPMSIQQIDVEQTKITKEYNEAFEAILNPKQKQMFALHKDASKKKVKKTDQVLELRAEGSSGSSSRKVSSK